MTNVTSTKRALLVSVLSMLLCASMLIGSTFAWFTDTASTGPNKITSGNLSVGLEYSTDHKNWANAEGAAEIFGKDAIWEPGHTQVLYFRVTNKGSLALSFKVATEIVKNTLGQNQKGEAIDLTKYIQFGIVETTGAFANAQAAKNAVTTPLHFQATANGAQKLEAGEVSTFALVAWMPESVGNEANHNGKAPEIQFGIHVLATQAVSESDSFGSQYDDGASFPQGPTLDSIVATPGTVEELRDILETALTGGSASGTITVNLEKDFDAAFNWTAPVGGNYSGVNNVIINGNGHTIKNLNDSLLSGVFGGYEGSLEINDLTIENANILGSNAWGVGAFLGSADSTNKVVFNNCHLVNSKVSGTDISGGVGGFVGASSAATVEINNSSVVNSQITSDNSVGAMFGLIQSALTVNNTQLKGNTLVSTKAGEWRTGLVAGTMNGTAAVTLTNVTESGNTMTQTAAEANDITDNRGGVYCKLFGRAFKTISVNGTDFPANAQ